MDIVALWVAVPHLLDACVCDEVNFDLSFQHDFNMKCCI